MTDKKVNDAQESVKKNEIAIERQTMNSYTRVYMSSHDKTFNELKKDAKEFFDEASGGD